MQSNPSHQVAETPQVNIVVLKEGNRSKLSISSHLFSSSLCKSCYSHLPLA
uniref:Uncharacterized protein n=1 Tax=Arundo donax TaxID=35708 RepID=A0A0A9C5Y2_ARUDO